MPQSKEIKPVEWVSKNIIRQIFNENKYFVKASSGEIRTRIQKSQHLDRKKLPSGIPYCTHSQIIFYYTKDFQPIAIVHQYLYPDGKIGASGLPDPKAIFFPDRTIKVLPDIH
jgi:hypothetical protein